MVCKVQIGTTWHLCDELVVAAAGISWGRGQRNDSAGGKVPTSAPYLAMVREVCPGLEPRHIGGGE